MTNINQDTATQNETYYTEINNTYVDESTYKDGYVTLSIDAWKTPDPEEEGESVATVKISVVENTPWIEVTYNKPNIKTNPRIQTAIEDGIRMLKQRYVRTDDFGEKFRTIINPEKRVQIRQGYRKKDTGMMFWHDQDNLVCKVMFDDGEVYGYDVNDIAYVDR